VRAVVRGKASVWTGPREVGPGRQGYLLVEAIAERAQAPALASCTGSYIAQTHTGTQVWQASSDRCGCLIVLKEAQHDARDASQLIKHIHQAAASRISK
jgi:glycine/D-amino acid oxidase-like deaminating enzyme